MESLPKNSQPEKEGGISRRSFLKGLSGLIIAGGATTIGVGDAFAAQDIQKDQVKTIENDEDRKVRLQKEMNFDTHPGRHTLNSVVVGSRFNEIKELRGKIEIHPELVDFEKAIYEDVNTHLIPVGKKAESEKIAMRYFSEYIKKYKDSGLTIENAVDWAPRGGFNRTMIYDLENKSNTWAVHAIVDTEGDILNDKYLPRYVLAYHELMHVEETERGAKEWTQKEKPTELLPAMQTVILADSIYKELFSYDVSKEIDYGVTVDWGKGKVALGKLANFYRKLEEKYGSIGKAMASEESLKFITGKI
jgi:hypothetical protein